MLATASIPSAAAEPQPRALLVDARPGEGRFGPTRVVCGLPLVMRHLLSAARDGGFEHAVVLTSATTHADVTRALAGHQIHDLTVEVKQGDEPADGTPRVEVDAREVVTRADLRRMREGKTPELPRLVVRDAFTAEAGRQRMLGTVAKSMHQDGVWCWLFVRPVSRLLVRALLRTPLTPNQVSVMSALIGVAASAVILLGGAWATSLLPLVILQLSMILDCCDGDVARLKLKFSRLGEWLDSMGDETIQLTLVAALGIGLARDGAHPAWAALGVASAAIMFATAVAIYRTLHRQRLPIDSAQYPWFFGTAAHAEQAPGGLVGLLGWVFRRDVFLTMVGLLCALDLRMWALCAMSLGAAILGSTMLVHQIVVRRARRSV